ncbi:hypothetical protein GIB67_034079 [Kingdonia uniflora]|uniref:DUF668 domain-containing protein n=1 Tax=Kingdonia uniflora TaxID=39325 RepID=A0A7J7M6F0_9MAGN|nr:hypothetical protein GIB67_034079 [Kingdonia uniflora]
MDRKVKKMEKFITISANLYQELKRFTEVENAVRIAHSSNDPNSRNLKMKAVLQLQEVNNLREISLWNKTYDYVIRLLARSLFTILKRIKHVFGGMNYWRGANTLHRSHSISGLAKSSVHPSTNGVIKFSSGFLGRPTTKSGPILSRKTKRLPSVGPFKGRFASENKSSMLQSFTEESHGHPRPNEVYSGIIRGKHKLLAPPPFALGANGLALHYANVIVEIDKLVQLPHSLTGPRARDNLYNMLPTSIRSSLRTRLKLYSENLVATSYDDPSLAVEWSEALERILEWLAPLADNMTTWQYERSFQQQNLVSRTNVFLVQTLYFADQVKTEAAITELLVGLNYLWRFGREYNEKASLDSGECDGYLMSNG